MYVIRRRKQNLRKMILKNNFQKCEKKNLYSYATCLFSLFPENIFHFSIGNFFLSMNIAFIVTTIILLLMIIVCEVWHNFFWERMSIIHCVWMCFVVFSVFFFISKRLCNTRIYFWLHPCRLGSFVADANVKAP